MKIYLASTAPGNEGSEERERLDISKRLLSYHHIKEKILVSDKVFQAIIREDRIENK
jgi:hypothetical protein